MKNAITLCWVCICCCISCNSSQDKSVSGAASSLNDGGSSGNARSALIEKDGKVKFSLRPLLNKKYRYNITTSTSSLVEAPSKEVESVNKIEAVISYENIRDSAGYSTLKMTYDKLHIEIKKEDERITIDADTAPDDQTQVEQILSSIKNSSLYISLNPKGEVTGIIGSREILDRAMKGILGDDAALRQLVQQLINKLAGHDFVEDNLKSAFFILPDTSVAKGDTWKRTTVQNADFSFVINSLYKLESLDDGVAVITGEGKIASNNNSSSLVMGQQLNTTMNGDQSADIKIDLNTGMLRSAKSKVTISGTVTVQGHELPVTIKTKKEISLE